MIKKIICIECPNGCALSVEIENSKVVKVGNAKCPRGEKYAVREIENPVRLLTSTILTEGLPLAAIPVRTDRPIPKADIFKAMEKLRKIRIKKPVKRGDVVVENLLGLGANVIATRGIFQDLP